jgi:trehalose 6-phosphate synthase/phosphatase
VNIVVIPVGIDPSPFIEGTTMPAVTQRIAELRSMFEGKKVIVSRDTVDFIESVPQKLKALETFFALYPEWQGKIIFFQICHPPPSHGNKCGDAEAQLRKEINEHVGRVNGKYSSVQFSPIQYLTQHLDWIELLSLYSVANVFLVTPNRDGMNLMSHEYIVCQRDFHGALVLSEFTGAARCLGGAVQVNPFSKREIAVAIHNALTMTEEERTLKHLTNYEYVVTNTSLCWCETFIDELLHTEVSSSTNIIQMLDIAILQSAYMKSTRRLILLDYEGTLVPQSRHPLLISPSSQLVTLLHKLSKDPRNVMYVVTGQDHHTCNAWLGHIPVGAACEHGCFFKPYRRCSWGTDYEAWREVQGGMDLRWRDVICPVLEDYAERTPGSIVEIKQATISWHYCNSDPCYGSFQTQELLLQLQLLASKFPVDVVIHKHKVIEVRPKGINKGVAVKSILDDVHNIDFILCIGDDKTDEDMFVAVEEKTVSKAACFTCTVKKKQTQARYYVEKQTDVLSMLEALARTM